MFKACTLCGKNNIRTAPRQGRKICLRCSRSVPCAHGVPRYDCRECNKKRFCEHGVERRRCTQCVGRMNWTRCETHGLLGCDECGVRGSYAFCQHGNRKDRVCPQCGPDAALKLMCTHGVVKANCKVCSWRFCEHGKRKDRCKECSPPTLCKHGRPKYECMECGGGRYCTHKRQRGTCQECSPQNFCDHGVLQRNCKACGKRKKSEGDGI